MIRECAARVLAGDSLRSICIDLNDRQVPTVTGARWSPQTLRRMLMSGRISGQRDHHREIVAAAEWDAIITPVETQRLRAKLGDPDRRTNRALAAICLPACCAAVCARCRCIAAAGGWRSPLCVREWPARWLRQDHDRGRAVGVVHRRGGAAPAGLARARRDPERPARRSRERRLAGRDRAGDRAAGRACGDVGQQGDQPLRVSDRGRGDQEAPGDRAEATCHAQPLNCALGSCRERGRVAGAMGGVDANSPAADRRGRHRSPGRRPGPSARLASSTTRACAPSGAPDDPFAPSSSATDANTSPPTFGPSPCAWAPSSAQLCAAARRSSASPGTPVRGRRQPPLLLRRAPHLLRLAAHQLGRLPDHVLVRDSPQRHRLGLEALRDLVPVQSGHPLVATFLLTYFAR